METTQDPQESENRDDWADLFEAIPYEEPPAVDEEPGLLERVLGRFLGRSPEPVAESDPIELDEVMAEEASHAEDVPAQPRVQAKPKRRKKQGGLTGRQKLVLAVLSVMTMILFGALIFVGVQFLLPAEAASELPPNVNGEIPIFVPSGTPVEWMGENLAVGDDGGTPEETPEDEAPKEPAEFPLGPTPTPPPSAAVTTQYDAQVRAEPNNVELRLKRGQIHLDLQAYEAALEDFEHVISLEKERAEAYVGMGKAYFHLQRWADAESALSTAISFNEQLPMPHFELGILYYFEGRYEEAFRQFDWAAELDPTFLEAEAWLAITAARMDDEVEAMGAAQRALALDETDPLAYVAHSWALRTQDPPSLEEAQADLLYAQGLEPYGFEVLNALARYYADHRPERLVEAEQLARYAINWSKNDWQRARALHTLGRVYLAQGRKADARQVLGEASALATSGGRVIFVELSQDLDRAVAPD